ncbi:hypothetical protein GCM10018785_11350 [Streptomyces longispororuber]|uniref:Uncharacterized protein n=1 Tax=Streptomyces longispororuber TaxID=68230 RepID=A0A918ZAD2_9ACTN|nr:hypothetical protein [Streptomyces longispororuber]GHE43531.1 hypothetical protein GCM10018785_11350 [Streptomyces longispororuber]
MRTATNEYDQPAKYKKDSTSSKYTYTYTFIKAGHAPGGFNYRTVPFRAMTPSGAGPPT